MSSPVPLPTSPQHGSTPSPLCKCRGRRPAPRADKGYIGAGIGILVPVRRPKGRSEQVLHADTRTTNSLIRGIRALGERAAAELKQRWRTLQYVTLSPSRIGDIARAALVLNEAWQ
ncbi:transposase family protein [Actinacidiphila glaucinigra]|uniref:transposase family protein n=1 Tax=Actinacidiphila glaucinigra TaxID=235986 RepID=UPI003812671F